MYSVFWFLLGAAAVHIVEEFVYPGGFRAWFRRYLPRIGAGLTRGRAVLVNGVFLGLVFAAIAVGESALAFSLSVASLIVFNGLLHIVGTVRSRSYSPGVVTAVALYIPVGIDLYRRAIDAGELTLAAGVASIVLGIGYQVLALAFLRSNVLRLDG